MKELLVMGVLSLGIFITVYYQAYRDRQRWKRISSGMSLFGNREDIPPLVLDGVSFEANQRNVLVIWGDKNKTVFYTVSDARKRIESARAAGDARAEGVRIFAWDGQNWNQRM